MDQLPRFGKRELICMLLFTCYYVVSVWRGFLFLWVLGISMDYVILLWHSLGLPYNYFSKELTFIFVFGITEAGVVTCCCRKMSLRTSPRVQIIVYLWSFETSWKSQRIKKK